MSLVSNYNYNPTIHRMSADVHRMDSSSSSSDAPNPEITKKKVMILAAVCFAALLISGPTFIIKSATLLVAIACIGLIGYILWKNRDQNPGEGFTILRSSNNPNMNTGSGSHTPIGGGHTPTSTHTTVGGGHGVSKQTVQPQYPTQTGTGHTPVGGGHQNTSKHTGVGSRAKK